jgi:hypothetical protein
MLRTQARPYFALAALLAVAGFVFFQHTERGIVEVLALFVFLGACIRSAALAQRDDPATSPVAGRLLISGLMVDESRRASARRRRRRRHRRR